MSKLAHSDDAGMAKIERNAAREAGELRKCRTCDAASMNMNQIEFEFCELALLIDLSFEAGLVNGTATIAYENDGEWFVREIALDGFRKRTAAEMADVAEKALHGSARLPMFERKPVIIDRASHAWLYGAIHDQLENGRFKAQIEDAIDEDREAARDDAADRKRQAQRDDRTEHSTNA